MKVFLRGEKSQLYLIWEIGDIYRPSRRGRLRVTAPEIRSCLRQRLNRML
jgi:hypothetical protein